MTISTIMNDIFGKVHNGTPISVSKDEGIPALVRLEMLINLYFPELYNNYQDLVSAKDKFGEMYAEVLSKDFSDNGILLSVSSLLI